MIRLLKRISRRRVLAQVVSILFAVTLILGWATAQAADKTLYGFTGGKDGAVPAAGLILDASGNLYGTTTRGGNLNGCQSIGCGVVFELSPNPAGGWKETVLHTFSGGKDGSGPATSLTLDAAGNLYGTTGGGGDHTHCSGGCGVAFELSPQPAGGWKETVLHIFTGGVDGRTLFSGLTFDSSGNLYGTTRYGGNTTDCNGLGCGIVYRLTPNPSGEWEKTSIYAFTGAADGAIPESGLLVDGSGNLYGTTEAGGNLSGCDSAGCGTVFKLSPNPDGSWTETVLYAFTGHADGGQPTATGLTFDAAGNLYGATILGGDGGCPPGSCGVVFELSPTPSGFWTETLLHSFSGQGDGGDPAGTLAFDAAGNLYGTAGAGGRNGFGVVFKLSKSGGSWHETALHNFSNGKDGGGPNGGVILDSVGNLYGTTIEGGRNNQQLCDDAGMGCGVIFEIAP